MFRTLLWFITLWLKPVLIRYQYLLADRFCGYLFDAPFPYSSTIPPGLAGSSPDDANLEIAMWSLCVELTSSAFSHHPVQGVATNPDAKPWQRQKVLTRPKFSRFRPRYAIAFVSN